MTERAHLRDLPAGVDPSPLDPDLDVFRPPEAQRSALRDIASDPRGHVVVAEEDDRTVGYVTFHPPGAFERWGADRTGRLIELGAIEVAPAMRGSHLGERLLEAAFRGGRYDATVVFATLYAWHYDLDRSGLGPLGYRRLLERLYAKAGLTAMPTSDPEVRADPANALLARIGPDAPEEVRGEFQRLRTLPPEAGP